MCSTSETSTKTSSEVDQESAIEIVKGNSKDLITTPEIKECVVRKLGQTYVDGIINDGLVPDDNDVKAITDCSKDTSSPTDTPSSESGDLSSGENNSSIDVQNEEYSDKNVESAIQIVKGTNKELETTPEIMECLNEKLGQTYVDGIINDGLIPDEDDVNKIFDCYLDPFSGDPTVADDVYATILKSIEEARNTTTKTPEQEIITLLSAENINPETGCGIRNYFATGEMKARGHLANYSLIYPDGVARPFTDLEWTSSGNDRGECIGCQNMHLEKYWREFIGDQIIRPSESNDELNSSKDITDIGFWDFKDYLDGNLNNINKGQYISWPRAHIYIDEYLVDGNMVFPKISFEEYYKNMTSIRQESIDAEDGTEAQINLEKIKTEKYLDREAFTIGLSLQIDSLVKDAPTGWRPDEEFSDINREKFYSSYSPERSIFTLGYLYTPVHLKINSLCQIEILLNSGSGSVEQTILVSDKILDITKQLEIYFSIDLSQKKVSLTVTGDENYPNETEVFQLPSDFNWSYTNDWDSSLGKINPEASVAASLCEAYEKDACSDLDSVSNRLIISGPLTDLNGFAGSIDWLYMANGVVDINTIKNKPEKIRTENPLPVYIPANISLSPGGYVASAQLNKSNYDSWTTETLAPEGEYLRLLLDVYENFEDDFDFIFLVNNDLIDGVDWPYIGTYLGWSNNNSGISLDTETFDMTRLTGSKGKLKGTIHFPFKDKSIQNGPSLHEVLHHWGNFSLAKGDLQAQSLYEDGNDYFLPEISSGSHWGLTSINGQLGGFNKDTLQELSNGDYKADPFGLSANGGNSTKYSNFELYLMGLIPEEEVEDIIMFQGVSSDRDRWTKYEWSAEEKIIVSVEDIIKKLGPRNPSYDNSQKEFKFLTLILTDKPLTNTEWTTYDYEAKQFEILFKLATTNRAKAELGQLSKK